MRLVGDAGAVARSRGLLSDIPFADGVISAHIRHGDKVGPSLDVVIRMIHLSVLDARPVR